MTPLGILSCAVPGIALTTLSATASPADLEKTILNGIWDFYPEGGSARRDIRVASFWDAPQDFGYPAESPHMRHGIHRKQFVPPADMKDKQLFLHIERVSPIAKVSINATQVGGEDSNGYLMLPHPGSLQTNLNIRLQHQALPTP